MALTINRICARNTTQENVYRRDCLRKNMLPSLLRCRRCCLSASNKLRVIVRKRLIYRHPPTRCIIGRSVANKAFNQAKLYWVEHSQTILQAIRKCQTAGNQFFPSLESKSLCWKVSSLRSRFLRFINTRERKRAQPPTCIMSFRTSFSTWQLLEVLMAHSTDIDWNSIRKPVLSVMRRHVRRKEVVD